MVKISHKPMEMDCPFTDEKIYVDTSIAPLIGLIWKSGIQTTNSCIKHGTFKKPCTHRTWIAFRRSDDAERFIEMVMSQLDQDDDLFKRMNGDLGFNHEIEDAACKGRHWIYEIDHTGIYNGELPRFSISIFFPLADYEQVFELFQNAIVEG